MKDFSDDFSINEIALYVLLLRARITGTTYTSAQLLAYLQDWVTGDGTFLTTYSGTGVRLRLDRYCPIKIGSFSEPECGISVDEATTQLFGPRSAVTTD